jgi:hypothetical protein
MTVASPPPPPGAPAPKKGMGPLGWIAIGCGAIAVLGIVAFAAMGWFVKRQVDKYQDNPTMAAAELIVRTNPDLELVSSDSDKNTMTIKNTKTGEVVTINAEDIKEGKISFETDKGTTVVDASSTAESGSVKMTGADGAEVTWGGGQAPKDLPGWVPLYPGSNAQGAMDATTPEGRTAMFSLSTDDSIDEVVEFYESKLKEAGLQVDKNTMEVNGQRSAILVGKSGDEKQTVSATIGLQDGKTSATITFQEKK